LSLKSGFIKRSSGSTKKHSQRIKAKKSPTVANTTGFVEGSLTFFKNEIVGDTAENVVLLVSLLLLEVLDATNDSSSFFLDVDDGDKT
jgi:hypothetical protein